jgi:hypothetical protein
MDNHPKDCFSHVQHRCERCEYRCIKEDEMMIENCPKVLWIPEIVVKQDNKAGSGVMNQSQQPI